MATAAKKRSNKAAGKTNSKPSIETFVYSGTDRKGKKTKGEINGGNIALAKAQLRKQGINAKKVKKKPKPLFGNSNKKITPMDITIFTRQMATMMKSGVPLVQAFDIVSDGLANVALRELLGTIKSDIESGNNFAQSLKSHPAYFDDLYVSLINSGEQSGALEQMLDRVALYKEKTEALKSKIKKAIKYPIAVCIVAFVVTTILLLKVVPTFQDLFQGFGADLPAFTLFVIGISEWMQSYWLAVVIGLILSVGAFKEAKLRSAKFRNALDRMALKAPIIGDIIFEATIARYARTLSTTFAAGVPLVEALESVAGATGNIVYKDAVNQIREDVSSGTQLQFAMRATEVFPPMAIQMVAIGEESGALDEMLDKVANYYEEEVDNKVDGLTSLMEPIIMSVLGVLVGGLITAMYLPIFQLGSVV